jgi:hypothetical protein
LIVIDESHRERLRECVCDVTHTTPSPGTKDALGAYYANIREVTALKQFSVRTFSILPFDVEHDAPEPLGFLCTSTATGEKLLYFTDTFYLKYTFSGLTHIMGECNYTKSALDEAVAAGHTRWEQVQRLAKSHMSLETFLEFLRSNDLSRLRQVYLLHMSADNSDAETMRRAVQKETGVEVYIHALQALAHTHPNKAVLDALGEADGMLTYNDRLISGTGADPPARIAFSTEDWQPYTGNYMLLIPAAQHLRGGRPYAVKLVGTGGAARVTRHAHRF